MIDLPAELIQEIVVALAQPLYPLQYGHKPEVTHALSQLCLTSRFLLNVSIPLLYSSVVISSNHQLNAFLSSPSAFRIRSRALWIRIGHLHDDASIIAELIVELGPHLHRLALDIPGDKLDTSSALRNALKCCRHLQDFTRSGYSPMQVVQPRPLWRNWTSLRHLILDGPLIDPAFIHSIQKLPHLTHLALIEPRWKYSDDGTEYAIFLNLLEAGQQLQQILLIYCSYNPLYISSLQRLRTKLKLENLRQDLQVSYMIVGESKSEKQPPPMTRIRYQIGDGTIWNRGSYNLLGPMLSTSKNPRETPRRRTFKLTHV